MEGCNLDLQFARLGRETEPDYYVAWGRPPEELDPPTGEVHLWMADLNLDPWQLHHTWQLLSQDELDRVNRFHFQRDSHNFIARRGNLRTILAFYLGVDARELRFDYGPRGKPLLAPQFAGGALRFNTSQSGGLALYAVSAEREVGIDLQMILPGFDWLSVARQFFPPAEIEFLLALPESMALEAFLRLWTRLEAVAKAAGTGLASLLKPTEARCARSRSGTSSRIEDSLSETGCWAAWDLRPAPGYLAALAVAPEDAATKATPWSDLHWVSS